MADEWPEDGQPEDVTETGDDALDDEEFGDDLLVVLPDGESFDDGSFFDEAEANVEGVTEADVVAADVMPADPRSPSGPVPVTILDVASDGFPMIEGKIWDDIGQGYLYFIVNAAQVMAVEDDDLRAMANLDSEVRNCGGQLVFSDFNGGIVAQIQGLGLYESISITDTEGEASDWLRKVVMESTGAEVQIARVPIGGGGEAFDAAAMGAAPAMDEMPTVEEVAPEDAPTLEDAPGEGSPYGEPVIEEAPEGTPFFEEAPPAFAESADEALAAAEEMLGGEAPVAAADAVDVDPYGEPEIYEAEMAPAGDVSGMDAMMTQSLEDEVVDLDDGAIVEEMGEPFMATPDMVTQDMGPVFDPGEPAVEEYQEPAPAASRIPDRPYVVVDGPPPGQGGSKLLIFILVIAVLGGGGYAAYHFGYLGPVEDLIAGLTGGGGGGSTDGGGLPPSTDGGSTDTGGGPVEPGNGGTTDGGGVTPPVRMGDGETDPAAESAGHLEALDYSVTDLLTRQ